MLLRAPAERVRSRQCSHSVTWEPVSTAPCRAPRDPLSWKPRAQVWEPLGQLVPKALSVLFLSCSLAELSRHLAS